MIVPSQDTLIDILTTEVAVGGAFEAPKIALYTNDIFPSRGSVAADFTFANFGGLTNQKAVIWAAPFLNPSQQAEVLSTTVLQWLTTATTGLPVTAYGWVLLDTAGAVLLAAERFANPYTFTEIGNSFEMVARLVMG